MAEVAKTVKDAKHSDLLMLIEAVAICCRAKKSRAIDNAVHYDKTWTPVTDEEAEKMVSDTTAYTVPEYANDGLHGASNGGAQEKFVVNEDAALGNRSEVGEIVSAEYKRGYDEGFAAGVASVMPPSEDPEPTPPPPTKKKKTAKPKAESIDPAYEHVPRLQSGEELNSLYLALNSFSFSANEDARDEDACYFGKTYTLRGGPRATEIPVIPEFLLPLAKCVAEAARAPSNYIQIHRMRPTTDVRPHKDPAGMIVSMLTVGQARTFRVGGTMPNGYYRMRQSQRKIEKHVPETEILMMPGDLLIFNGGRIVHSMFPAAQDPNFEPGGYDVRYSLLFRWTTDEMRERGTSQKVLGETQHAKSYQEAIENYRNGLTDFLGRAVRS